jgi:hypothetical protein
MPEKLRSMRFPIGVAAVPNGIRAVGLAMSVVAAVAITLLFLTRRELTPPREATIAAPFVAAPAATPPRRESAEPGGESRKIESAEKPSRHQPPTAAEMEEIRKSFAEYTARMYEDVGEAVGLDEAEAAAVIRTLVDQRFRDSWMQVEQSKSDPVTRVAAFNELVARHRSEIEGQIGRARMPAFIQYETSLDARSRVETLRRNLEAEGMPLTESQRRALIRKSVEGGAYLPPLVFTGAESQTALFQEWFVREQQSDQLMLSIARPVLTTPQWQYFDDRVQADTEATEARLLEMETSP